jgi:hypothetical protein
VPAQAITGDDIDRNDKVDATVVAASSTPTGGGATPTGNQPSQGDTTPPGNTGAKPVAKQPVLISDAALSGGYGTRYYTYAYQVPLKRGEKIAFARGRGYYAYLPIAEKPPQPPTKPGAPPDAPPKPNGPPKPNPGVPATPGSSSPGSSGAGTFNGGKLSPQIDVKAKTGKSKPIQILLVAGGHLVRATVEAAVTLTWSAGSGPIKIAFDGQGVSITDGPLTISDPAFLWLFGSLLRQANSHSVQDSRYPIPYEATITVAKTHVPTPLGDAEFSTSVAANSTDGIVKAEATVGFSKDLPSNSGTVTASYSITATFTPLRTPKGQPPSVPVPALPPDLQWLAEAALIALALLGFAEKPTGRLA